MGYHDIPCLPGMASGLPLIWHLFHTSEYKSVDECDTSFTFFFQAYPIYASDISTAPYLDILGNSA